MGLTAVFRRGAFAVLLAGLALHLAHALTSFGGDGREPDRELALLGAGAPRRRAVRLARGGHARASRGMDADRRRAAAVGRRRPRLDAVVQRDGRSAVPERERPLLLQLV